MTLAGRTAIVTGGSRGIGRAIALALAEAGARVAFCHPGDARWAQTLEELSERTEALAVLADVSDETQVISLFDQVTDRLGAPNLLVSNAGILHEAPLTETRAEDFDRVIAVNLRGTFLCAREFARRTDKGRIVTIASDLAHLGRQGMVAYAASKGGVIALTRSLARELAPGILVNAIAPGPIDTDMTSPASMSPEQLALDLDSPLARFGRPEDVAAMAVYLCGPGGDFITGQCFGVNGGSAMT